MRGGCLCGAVVFEATAPLRDIVACHCSQCRKTSGHVWAATSIPLERFHLLKDEGLVWYRSSEQAERGFCKICSASLFWRPEDEPRIAIAAGALEPEAGETGLRLVAHIHKEDAGDYYSPAGAICQPSEGAEILQAACLCGANRFSLPGPMGAVVACHCQQCRKASGHYAARFCADPAQISWAAQNTRSYRLPGGAEHGFCPVCAASLWFRAADGAFALAAGVFAAPTGGQLTRHIFMAAAHDYDAPDDGLPQHEEWD